MTVKTYIMVQTENSLSMIKLYSQVHKYWDIDTVLTFLALYTTTMDFK